MKAKLMLLSFVLSVAFSLQTKAQHADSVMVYTKERPLVYEDVWDLWPYAFLNDKGEPEGYNIDLIRLMMNELDIPFVIRLKPSEEAFNDLKAGRSDLMLGLAVGFHDEYGLYSKNAVTLFTQSVLTPKSKPVEIKTFRDLGKPGVKVIVNQTSMCYHLMKDYGWEENAIPANDIREVIQQMSAREEGQMVWNTLTLKWLMHRYLIDNLQLTPVNMPHGEYKFMSNDQHLLDLLDEKLTELNTTEMLLPLQDKWFYPERQHKQTPLWVWYALGATIVLLLILTVYTVSYRLQDRRLKRQNNRRNRRLALILQTSHVRMWTYDIVHNQFAWRNENGQVAYTYTMKEFSQRYSPEDFERLKKALDELAGYHKAPDEDEKSLSLSLRAKDTENHDTSLHDFIIALSVLRRDDTGKPTVIIGTKKDVTVDRNRQRQEEERTLRFWSIFYTPVMGILYFGKEGKLEAINPKACEIYGCDEDEITEEKPALSDFFDIGNMTLDETDGYYASQIAHQLSPLSQQPIKSCNEVRLMTVTDDSHELLGIFAVVRDIKQSVSGIELNREEKEQLRAIKAMLQKYDTAIDNVLRESDVRLASYSPTSHMLTIHRSVGVVQHTLTQTRCMTLVHDHSKAFAMRTLNTMDDRADRNITADIRTTLRGKGRKRLELQFCLMPMHDKNGNVTEYLGLLRDLSEQRDTEEQLAVETAKVQEVENTKNSFMRNMVQEIKTPLGIVEDLTAQINPDHATANEGRLCQGILKNADSLLHLIDNILYLSRLQARMVEIVKKPCNYAELFHSQCMAGWERFRNEDTRYIVENPYEQLVVDIDAENLGQVIGQVTANAAQHTSSGVVRARYDYIGRRLIVSLDDTGEGIPTDVLEELNSKENYATPNTKGLGLAITKELVNQMGGTVEISSELGSGTTVYIMIPCHASVIKRKRTERL